METTEECVIEIKKAIARIEEQIKTLFRNFSDYKEWSQRLHEEHSQRENTLKNEASERHRIFDVKLSKHDTDIQGIQKSLTRMEDLMGKITQNSARTKGIALGLGMAGGAIVSILTIVAEIIS